MTQKPDQQRAALLLRLSRDMLAFGRVCMPDMFTRKSPDFHGEVTSALMDPTELRLNVIAPRGSAKSSIIGGVYVLWHIFLEHIFLRAERGPRFVVLCSKTQSHAVRLLRTLKSVLEDSQRFRALFGDWGPDTARKWTEKEVILRDGTVIMALGTRMQVRGLKEKHRRPSSILLDDPENEDNTKTVEAMESNLSWLLQALEPAVQSDSGKLVVVGTPQHQRSMVMVLREKPDWTTFYYQALYEEEGEEKSLWPEKWSVEDLKEKEASLRAIGRAHVFYREYQCSVIPGEDALFKPEYMRYWRGHLEQRGSRFVTRHYLHVTHEGLGPDGRPLKLDEERVVPVHVTTGVDPASSVSRRADYSTIVTIAATKDEKIYVLPYVRKRMPPLDVAKAIVRQYKMYKPAQTRIESTGYQTMLRDYLARSGDVDVHIPGLSIKEMPHEKKEQRLMALEPLFARGLVHLQPGMQSLKDELINFPKGKHDDLADALYYATRGIRTPTHDAPDEEEERRRRVVRRDPMLA